LPHQSTRLHHPENHAGRDAMLIQEACCMVPAVRSLEFKAFIDYDGRDDILPRMLHLKLQMNA
jgi:hypothetical protein